MILIYRISEANNKPASLGDSSSEIRWEDKTKAEILKKCWLSLQPGLSKRDTVVLVLDRVSEVTLYWLQTTTEAKIVCVNAEPGDNKNHPYTEFFDRGVNSCIDLAKTIVCYAEKYPEEIIYVCEDDYLHLPKALPAMRNIFSGNYEGFYVPYDYPDRYFDNLPTNISATPFGSVRTIRSSTLTLAAKGKTWSRFKYEILRSSVFSEDSWTWKAFSLVPALSPAIGHATHLQNNCITPYVDWLQIWDSIDDK